MEPHCRDAYGPGLLQQLESDGRRRDKGQRRLGGLGQRLGRRCNGVLARWQLDALLSRVDGRNGQRVLVVPGEDSIAKPVVVVIRASHGELRRLEKARHCRFSHGGERSSVRECKGT